MLLTGLVAPAIAAPASPDWSSEERGALTAGRTVYRYWRDDAGGQHGVSAALVDASPESIWARILDLDAYVDFLPYVTASRLEDVQVAPEGGDRYLARVDFTTLGVTTSYALVHRVHVAEGYATFVMTPIGSSPVEGATGWWKVRAWGDGAVLVEYAVDLDLGWYVPGFLQKRAARRGLPGIVTLVKRRVESPP